MFLPCSYQNFISKIQLTMIGINVFVIKLLLGALPLFRQSLRSTSGLVPHMVDINCSGNEQSFSECIMASTDTCSTTRLAGVHCQGTTICVMYTCVWNHKIDDFNLTEQSDIGDDCVHGSVSLVGGSSGMEGTVLICINGLWGSICDDFWDIRDANVVCRQMGIQTSHSSTTGLLHFVFMHGFVCFHACFHGFVCFHAWFSLV